MNKEKTRIYYEFLKKYFDDKDIPFRNNINIEAKCFKCDRVCNKKIRQFIHSGCYCIQHTRENGRNKMKATNMEKYGCEYPSQNKKVKAKAKAKNMGVNIRHKVRK
jgi:hypothetical protein